VISPALAQNGIRLILYGGLLLAIKVGTRSVHSHSHSVEASDSLGAPETDHVRAINSGYDIRNLAQHLSHH
jgi:hypothetical protein